MENTPDSGRSDAPHGPKPPPEHVAAPEGDSTPLRGSGGPWWERGTSIEPLDALVEHLNADRRRRMEE